MHNPSHKTRGDILQNKEGEEKRSETGALAINSNILIKYVIEKPFQCGTV